jgi:hypothetical protein
MSCRQEASVLVADALASQLCAAQDALRGRERSLDFWGLCSQRGGMLLPVGGDGSRTVTPGGATPCLDV